MTLKKRFSHQEEPVKTIGSYPVKILRNAEVVQLTGISPTGIWERINNGTFPSKIPLGGKIVGFYEHEVLAVLNAYAAGRTDKEVKELVTLMHNKRKEQADAFLADLIA